MANLFERGNNGSFLCAERTKRSSPPKEQKKQSLFSSNVAETVLKYFDRLTVELVELSKRSNYCRKGKHFHKNVKNLAKERQSF